MANGLDLKRIARSNPLYAELDDKLENLKLSDRQLAGLFWFTFGANYNNQHYLETLKRRINTRYGSKANA